MTQPVAPEPSAPASVAASAAPPAVPPAAPPPALPAATPAEAWAGRAWPIATALLAIVALLAILLAWSTRQRMAELEAEMARRQAASTEQAAEARLLARQADQGVRDALARLSLLDARLNETALQRSQVEELIQGLARSRDENVLADIDAALRGAMQHAAITGSTDALLQALLQVDERLAGFEPPRLERVRRAVAQDLERVRGAAATDVAALAARVDEVLRGVDELPLVAAGMGPSGRDTARDGARGGGAAEARVAAAAASAAAATPPALADDGAWARLRAQWRAFGAHLWHEAANLVRVRRLDVPEAALLAPEQALYVRENLKLRLLNARLALLSRQFDTAQADLRDAQALLARWFDRDARRVAAAAEALRQVSAQARPAVLPRPDATLAAIAILSPTRR